MRDAAIFAPTLGRWQILASTLWGVVLLASCTRVLCFPSEKQQGVYVLHEEAGRHWLAGEPVYPDRAGWGVFPYGPLTAVFLIPFAALPQGVGNALWRLFTICVYLTALRRWSRSCLALPSDQFGLLALLVLPLTGATMLNGQIGGLVVSLLMLAAADAAEERWTNAAVFAALAGIIKVYPLAFGLLLAVVFPRRYAVRLTLAVLACLLLPFCFQRPEYVVTQYRAWFHLLHSADGNPWYIDVANRNIALPFQAVGWPVPFAVYRIAELTAAAVAAGLCVVLRWCGRPLRPLTAFVFGLAGSWMTLFGPGTESFTYILVGPTLAALLLADRDRRSTQIYRLALGGSWALFTAASVCVWISHGTWILDLGPHPLAGVLLLACLLLDQVESVWKNIPGASSPWRGRPRAGSAGMRWRPFDGRAHRGEQFDDEFWKQQRPTKQWPALVSEAAALVRELGRD